MSQDIISDALNMIMNAKKSGKKEVAIARYSKFLLEILNIAKKAGYIEKCEIDEKEKKLIVHIGELNECRAIKPRFFVMVPEIEKYIRRYLPARNFGIIIVSTSKGLLTHEEAQEKKIGGSLIAYFY